MTATILRIGDPLRDERSEADGGASKRLSEGRSVVPPGGRPPIGHDHQSWRGNSNPAIEHVLNPDLLLGTRSELKPSVRKPDNAILVTDIHGAPIDLSLYLSILSIVKKPSGRKYRNQQDRSKQRNTGRNDKHATKYCFINPHSVGEHSKLWFKCSCETKSQRVCEWNPQL